MIAIVRDGCLSYMSYCHALDIADILRLHPRLHVCAPTGACCMTGYLG